MMKGVHETARITYQLLQVPVADLHVSVVVIHALGEVLGGTGAVVLLLLLLLLGSGSLCRLGRGR